MTIFSEGALVFFRQDQSGLGDERGALEIVDDLAGQFLHRRNHIGQPGVDGASGHAVEFGRGRGLHEDHSPFFLDGPQAQRAVGAHPREDDADAAVLLVIRQRAEKEINRQTHAARRDGSSRCRTPWRMDISLFGGIT